MLHCAKIVNTHGLTGEVKALCFADDLSFFDNIEKVYTKEGKPLTLLQAKQHKGALLMRFEEVNSIDEANALKDLDLFVKREDADALPEGRYYVVDILGIEVFTDKGRKLGRITDVFKTGSNDVYTVSGEGREYLVPVIEDVIAEMDIAGGKIVIKPLKGLIDDED
jgi:16S rRNA processing protein RimM